MRRLIALALVVLVSAWVAPDGGLALAADAAAEGGKSESPNLFATKAASYVFNLLQFLLLFGVLALLVWPKILGGLRAREDKIRGDLTDAQRAKADADATLKDYQAKLAEARQEAQQLSAQARKDAEQLGARLKSETEAEITRMKDRATTEIAQAQQQATDELYARLAELSTQIAGKILQREINPNDQQRLVDESLEQFAQASNN
ncbi:MAG: F0F1 ATP synthase subunit B [Planctomycetota bacterium]